MRDLINIVETIADDHGLNKILDQKIAQFPSEMQTQIIDGLDIIKRSKNGIAARDWIREMLLLNPEIKTAAELAPLMKLILREFDFCVKRSPEGIYLWSDTVANHQDDDMDPLLKAAATQQIQLSYDVLAEIRRRGTFTEQDIIQYLSGRGLPPHFASMFFDQVVRGMLGKSVTKTGDTFTYTEEKPLKAADHVGSMLSGLTRSK